MVKPTKENKLLFNKARNILTNKLRQAHRMYYQNKIKEEKQNLKIMWDIFGSVINPQKMKRQNNINSLQINQTKKVNNKTIVNTVKITDDQEIANTINNFFSTVGPNLAKKHNTNPNEHIKYLKDKINSTMYLFPTNQLEIANLIMNLNKKNQADVTTLAQNY